MKCAKCGAELPEGSLFCFNCGARVEQSEEEKKQAPGTEEVSAEPAGGGESAQEPTGTEGAENPAPEESAQEQAPGEDSAAGAAPETGDAESRPPEESGAEEPAPEPEKTEDQPQAASAPAEGPGAAETGSGFNQGAPAPQEPPAAAARKSGKMKIILPIVIVAVVVVAAVAVFLNMGNPKETVKKSLNSTITAIKEEKTGLSGYLGLPEVLESIKTGKTRQELSAGVGIGPLMGVPIDGDVGLSAVVDRDAETGTYGTVSLTLFGMDEHLAEFYGDAEQWLVSVPLFFEDSLYVDRAQLKEMAESGELFTRLESSLGVELDDMMKDALRLLAGVETEDGQSLISLNLIAEYMDYSAQVRETLIDHTEVKKAEKKSFQIGGSDTDCNGYLITIPEEDCRALTANFGEFYRLRLIPFLDEIDRVLGHNEYDYESDIDAVLAAVDNLCTGGLELTAYVGPQSRLVSVELTRDFTVDGAPSNLTVVLNLLGEKNPADDMALTADLSSGDTTLAIGLDRNLTETDTDIHSDLILHLQDDQGYNMDASLESALNKESGDCSVKVALEDESGVASAALSGILENMEQGRSFTLAFDTLELVSDGETIPIDLQAKYAVSPIEGVDAGSIEGITARDRLNVLEASQSDWTALSEEANDNLVELENQIFSLLLGGIFGGTDFDVDSEPSVEELLYVQDTPLADLMGMSEAEILN